jgi:ParB-like chromosome segregation protein Spo0J
MEPTADEAIEIEADALGERLAEVRLLRGADAEMAASLRRYGQLSPLLCYRGPTGRLEVLDGMRRLRVAQQYGFPSRLRVRVLGVDERGALAALFALHRGEAGLSELEQAFVVRALVREQGMMQAEVAQLLRRHPSWVSRRLLLVEALAPEVQVDVRLGLVHPTAAREIARLPRGTQDAAARAIATHGLSAREAARLCARVLSAGAVTDDDVSRLLDESEPRRAPSEVDLYERHLDALDAAAMRVGQKLAARPPSQLAPADGARLRARLQSTRGVLGPLCDLIDHLESTP